jgi:hypothetical protein
MPKIRRPSFIDIERWISEGHGQGHGDNYRPFYQARDVPSSGRSHIVPSLKFNRVHQYFSDNEYYVHLLSEFEPSVIEIREQYALLPWDETQKIAIELGIKYPNILFTKTPTLLTTDLLLTIHRSESLEFEAVAVKPSYKVDLNSPKASKRVHEKLLIEKIYWQRRKVPFRVCTEKNIPILKARNLDLLSDRIFVKSLNWLTEYLEPFRNAFYQCWTSDRCLNEIITMISNKLFLDKKYSFNLFARSVWLHLISVDLESTILSHIYPIKMIR